MAINIILALLIILEKKIIITKKLVSLLLLYCGILLLLCFSDYFANTEFILSVLTPFPLFLIYTEGEYNGIDFMEKYTNVMFVIASLSLFFFIFGSLLDIINPTGFYSHQQIGWGPNDYYDFYHLYCEGQYVSALGYLGVRNISLFLEGPMLTYTLSFALYYELFLRKQGTRKLYPIVIIITIATSFSTTGLVLVVVLLYLKFYDKLKHNGVLRLFVVPIILGVVIFLSTYIIQDKFVSNVYSSSARVDDIIAAFKCFISNILYGVGYQNMEAIDPYRSFIRLNAGLSTGIGAILAYGGLIWGIWYIIPTILSVINYVACPRARKQMGFVIMAFALLLVTVVQNRVLCTIINALCWQFVLCSKDSKLINVDKGE
ncbi:MAG: hypothetical protein Q4F28_01985 [Eubacteriales bacterium]|nr:hypothetical protein [Eubacteriales bacterium]